MTYRKKPVEIEAVQYTGNNLSEIESFTNTILYPIEEQKLLIPTLEGTTVASINDYIIRGVKGEYYACKPDIFALTYESIEEDFIPMVIDTDDCEIIQSVIVEDPRKLTDDKEKLSGDKIKVLRVVDTIPKNNITFSFREVLETVKEYTFDEWDNYEKTTGSYSISIDGDKKS